MKYTVEQIQQILKEKMPPGIVMPRHTRYGHFYEHVPTSQTFASVTTKSGILEGEHLKKWAANLAVQYIDKNWDIITPENKPEIYKGAVMAHVKDLEQAGDIGTQGHNVIERYLNAWINTKRRPQSITAFITGTDTRLHAIARSAEQFCVDFNAVPIVSEMKVTSVKYGYGGTLDSLMMIGRVLEKGMTPLDGTRCVHFWGEKKSGRLDFMECMFCGRQVQHFFCLVDWKTSNSIEKPEYAMQGSAYWQALYEMTGLKPEDIFVVRLDKDRLRYEVMRITDRRKAFGAFINTAKVYDWLNDGVSKLYPIEVKERITIGSIK